MDEFDGKMSTERMRKRLRQDALIVFVGLSSTFFLTFSVVLEFGPELSLKTYPRAELAETLRALASASLAAYIVLFCLVRARQFRSEMDKLRDDQGTRTESTGIPNADLDILQAFFEMLQISLARLMHFLQASRRYRKKGRALYSRNTQVHRSQIDSRLWNKGWLIFALLISGPIVWPIETIEIYMNIGSIFRGAGRAIVNWISIQKMPDKFQEKLFLFLGPAGFSLLFWRTYVANKQANLSEIGLNIDRFRQGCELLASVSLIKRQAGVVALKELALNYEREASAMVLEVLISFMKTPNEMLPAKPYPEPTPSNRPDLHAAFRAIIVLWKNDVSRSAYLQNNFELNLNHIELKMGSFEGAYLSRVNLRNSKFHWCNFEGANFQLSDLSSTDFRGSNFCEASFVFTHLMQANFAGCEFAGVEWLDVHFSRTVFGAWKLDGRSNVPAKNEGDTIIRSTISEELISKPLFKWYSDGPMFIGLEENDPPMTVHPSHRKGYCRFSVELLFKE